MSLRQDLSHNDLDQCQALCSINIFKNDLDITRKELYGENSATTWWRLHESSINQKLMHSEKDEELIKRIYEALEKSRFRKVQP